MSFKLSNLAKAEKSIDVRENDKDVREIDIHLAEVLRLIDPFDFVPAVHFAQRIDLTMLEPLRRREPITETWEHWGEFLILIRLKI